MRYHVLLGLGGVTSGCLREARLRCFFRYFARVMPAHANPVRTLGVAMASMEMRLVGRKMRIHLTVFFGEFS